MRLPNGYNERLQRSFSWLRMRWSEYQLMWLLEAKTAYGRTDIDPGLCNPDALVQRRDGYTKVGEYTPAGLPPLDRFIPLLQRNWTGGRTFAEKHTGTAENQEDAWNRELVEREAKIASSKREEQRLQNYDIANQLWDIEHTASVQVPHSYEI